MAKVLAPLSPSLARSLGFPTGWKFTLGIVFAAQFFSAIGFSMVFPFLPLYIESLGSRLALSTEALAGLVIAVQSVTMMIAAPIWGVVADRFGRKKMILRAMVGGGIFMILMGFVQSAEQLILLRALQGMVTGTVSANNALVAASAPRERVGFAMGALQLGLWSGVAVGPLLGGVLADLFGYNIPFVVTAVLLLIGALVISVGVHEDFSPPKEKTAIHPTAFLLGWKMILGTSGVRMVLLMRFLVGLARSIIIPIAPLFVVSLIISETETNNTYAGLMLAGSSATSTFGAVYLGSLGDRVSHKKVLFWCALVAMALYIPQVFVANVWQLLILQGMVGIAAGGLVAAPSALLSRYTDKGSAGAVYGLDNSVWSASKAVAPLLGATIAIWIGMRGAFAASALVFGMIALIAWFCLPQDDLYSAETRGSRAEG
ncbi:MAG: MFS transporter [Chloroflexota bacterium]|nr:MFS transporter [Chloroflexota bacterium]